MIEKLVAGAVSVGATASIGAAASSSSYHAVAQYMPIATGIICAIIVWTITVMNSTKKRIWTYNVLVGLLVTIFTSVVIDHFDLKLMMAMSVGMTAGSMGVGVIGFVKPLFIKILGFAADEVKKRQ